MTETNKSFYGWNTHFQEHFAPYEQLGFDVARVTVEQRGLYTIVSQQGELTAEVTGKLRHASHGYGDFPAVGDWVVIQTWPGETKASIHAVLPRQSKFSRKVAGNQTEEQIVAANINTVFLVMALNQNFNLRRLERLLIVAWDSGASPIIVLSKMDLCEDVDAKMQLVESVAMGVPMHAVSVFQEETLQQLSPYLAEGVTVALLGSSGVGKSSLTNMLLGESVLRVHAARADDDRGRHTTTYRQLVCLPSGALLIDTPGMRELQLWDSEDGIHLTFDDVESLASDCKFTDCQHQAEPGCAVQAAISEGILSTDRLMSYRKMLRELAHLERRKTHLERQASRNFGRKQAKAERSRPYRR